MTKSLIETSSSEDSYKRREDHHQRDDNVKESEVPVPRPLEGCQCEEQRPKIHRKTREKSCEELGKPGEPREETQVSVDKKGSSREERNQRRSQESDEIKK